MVQRLVTTYLDPRGLHGIWSSHNVLGATAISIWRNTALSKTTRAVFEIGNIKLFNSSATKSSDSSASISPCNEERWVYLMDCPFCQGLNGKRIRMFGQKNVTVPESPILPWKCHSKFNLEKKSNYEAGRTLHCLSRSSCFLSLVVNCTVSAKTACSSASAADGSSWSMDLAASSSSSDCPCLLPCPEANLCRNDRYSFSNSCIEISRIWWPLASDTTMRSSFPSALRSDLKHRFSPSDLHIAFILSIFATQAYWYSLKSDLKAFGSFAICRRKGVFPG